MVGVLREQRGYTLCQPLAGPGWSSSPAEAPNPPIPQTPLPLPILPTFNFSPFPEDLDAEGHILAPLPHCLGWGTSRPCPGRWQEKLRPQQFCSALWMVCWYFSACQRHNRE